jgi:uncharacterized protein (TIGR02453 family)
MQNVNPTTFSFFKKLEKNNSREWFLENKTEFKSLEGDIKKFSNRLFDKLCAHDSIEKWKVFRIYRDVRFSKNKTPYKTHFGVAFQRTKPQLRGGYYLHISASNSFLACGFWDPNPADLLRIRKEMEVSGQEFRDITQAKDFKSVWGELVGDELKTCPKGFDKTHPEIKLLRKKQYLFSIPFSDQEVLQDNFMDTLNEAIKSVRPFVNFMTEVLTTDLNGESLLK